MPMCIVKVPGSDHPGLTPCPRLSAKGQGVLEKVKVRYMKNQFKILSIRPHKGTGLKKTRKKKESRGRKPKLGRTVTTVAITLYPTLRQKALLANDLELFTYFYSDTIERLNTQPAQEKNGMYSWYDPTKKRLRWVKNKDHNKLPHSPKYIMGQQEAVFSGNEAMHKCTYQVLFRATVTAFDDILLPENLRRITRPGDMFEAKLKYQFKNGYIYLGKHNEYIRIKEENLPKGTLERILIRRFGDVWTAELEILEPYDKVDDIKEKKSMIETDSVTRALVIPNIMTEETLFVLANKFSRVANYVVRGRVTNYQKALWSVNVSIKYEHIPKDLVNMATVAGIARVKKVGKDKVPQISKKYFAISEGFIIDNGEFRIDKWGITIPIKNSKWLEQGNFDYVVVARSKYGGWEISGRKKKKHIWRSFKAKISNVLENNL